MQTRRIFAMTAFRPLQPATADCIESRQHWRCPTTASKLKRRTTLGACVACRERKSKCDGNRPVCKSCAQRETDCLYELAPGERPSDARKRKNEQHQSELLGLRHLYDSLRSCPEHKALEILHQIRVSPSDTPVLDCLSGLPRPIAQACPSNAQHTKLRLTTQKAGPSQFAALPSFHSAEGSSRDERHFLPQSAGLPEGRTEKQYGMMPDVKVPHRYGI